MAGVVLPNFSSSTSLRFPWNQEYEQIFNLFSYSAIILLNLFIEFFHADGGTGLNVATDWYSGTAL